MVKRALLLSVAAAAASCVRVSEGRAERDRAVGAAEIDGLSIVVDDGLAAVRALQPARVDLWGNAPALSLRLVLDAARDVELRVDNAMADARAFVGARVIDSTAPGTRRAFVIPADAFAPSEGRFAARVLVRPPDADEPRRFRFAMYADVQEAIDRVQDVYARMNAEEGVSFALMAGDQTTHGGPDELEVFQREMATLRFPVFATLGNHELGKPEVPYHDWFGRGSSSFELHGARFTLLDSASATIDAIVYDWLDDWLARGRGRVHVVAMHIPPIDPIGVRSGSFASRNEANKLLARLAEGRVDLTLYGHVHSYYAFENAGIPAYIAGGGGAIPERFDNVGRHFLVIDVDPVAQTHATRLVRVD
ncbi:MAG: metallophosphoesterase [Deltaproteobacteria bacterium]|nr:metallophosphoesterase [Deltaproteobacteria bacterium]